MDLTASLTASRKSKRVAVKTREKYCSLRWAEGDGEGVGGLVGAACRLPWR